MHVGSCAFLFTLQKFDMYKLGYMTPVVAVIYNQYPFGIMFWIWILRAKEYDECNSNTFK